MRRKQIRRLVLISLGFLLLCAACGIKGPPVVSRAVVPLAVADLKAEVVGREVRLTWSVPRKGDRAFDGIEGFRVFRSRALDAEGPCPGCPIPFFEHLDIKLKDPSPAEAEEGQVACHDVVNPGERYAYKVAAYHKSGWVSEDSNIVQVTVK